MVDNYIKGFLNYSKLKFKNNLAAIVLYGSRVWGFSGKESDYDLFVLFKKNSNIDKKEVELKFPKCSLIYFITLDKLYSKIKQGHFVPYAVLLKASRVLYKTKEYNYFIKRIKKLKFDVTKAKEYFIKEKNEFELRELNKKQGVSATTWAYHSINKRMWLLTYSKTDKIELKFQTNLELNKYLFTESEYKFLIKLNKKVLSRKELNKKEKSEAYKILKKLCKVIK